MIRLFVNGEPRKFETTIFPDGTSQVWKIVDGPSSHDDVAILWMFEKETELFHICQLVELLHNAFETVPNLVCPYLPYGRQDKDVTNETSFALTTALNILTYTGISKIETFDAHSKNQNILSHKPTEFHNHLLSNNNYDLVCYPDKGAAERYSKFNAHPFIWAEKVRDQLTGEIKGLKIETGGQDLVGKDILIIDDICDGGMTFIKVAQALNFNGPPARIDLAVSHGLFSKGKQVLYDAGIGAIYTTNSLLRNPEGYEVIPNDFIRE